MNREIKFRVWDNQVEKFITHVPTGGFDMASIAVTLQGVLFWETEYGHGVLEKERFIIQQFTGLTDKNGKDIYEGDILEKTYSVLDYKTSDGREVYKDKRAYYTVKFGEFRYIWGYDKTSTMVGIYLESVYQSKKLFIKDDILDMYEPYIVVGNIFENPELLSENKT